MSDANVPHGWVLVAAADAGSISLGRQRSPKNHNGPNMKPYLRVANVFEDRIDTTDVMSMHFTPEEFERFRLNIGDVLLNEGQSPELLGRPAIYRGQPADVAFTNSLIRFQAADGVLPEWALIVFRHHMHSGRFARESRITTNIAHLSSARFATTEFPIPPLSEQRRIVVELARRLSHLDSAEEGLRSSRARINAARRSVIGAAVTGRLLPLGNSEGSARELIADLGVEALADTDIDGLPKHWVVTRLDSLAMMSLGKMLDAKRQTGQHQHPYLRNINVRWFRFDLSEVGVMDITPAEMDRVSLQRGDLVVCEGGEPGRCAVWDGEPIAIQKALHRVRPHTGISGSYLALVLRWWTGRDGFGEFVTGSTIKHIPKERLRLLPVPLPPTSEQLRIVSEAERRLSLLDVAERAVEENLKKVGRLRRSLLAAAFSGRLVKQDPDEEPASVLLQRIKAERGAMPAQKGTPKSGTTKEEQVA